jgi:hypothetical protein
MMLKWLKRRRAMTVEQAIGPALKEIMRTGTHDEFQAGYAAALSWTWEQSGLPPTAESVGLHAMAGAIRIAKCEERYK